MVTYGEFVDAAESEVVTAVSEPNKDKAGKTKPVDPLKLNISSSFQEEGTIIYCMTKREQLVGKYCRISESG